MVISKYRSHAKMHTHLDERPRETPKSAEAAAVHEVQLLLLRVLAGQHILYDGLHGSQDDVIV